MADKSLNVLLERVNSEESFLAFIKALAKDRRDAVVVERKNPKSRFGSGAGGWEKTSIEDYLEGATAWAEDTNFGRTQGLPPDNYWKRFAVFLYLGKIYE